MYTENPRKSLKFTRNVLFKVQTHCGKRGINKFKMCKYREHFEKAKSTYVEVVCACGKNEEQRHILWK